MRKIRWLKDYKERKISDISNAGEKSAENFVNQGYAEYADEIEKNRKKLINKAIKSNNLEQVKLAKESIKKKQKQYIENQIGKPIAQFSDYFDLANQLIKLQPFYYNNSNIWWFWNKEEFKWEIIDETDLMNIVDENVNVAGTIHSNIKNEILEALKRISRKNKPKEIKPTWIQFKDIIIDIETDEKIKASSKYFVTNPIPIEIGKSYDTPIIDKIFREWVGEKYIKTLYEIISYCILPNYPIHRIFCFIGAGLNGKTKFLELLELFLGIENCTSTELDVLLGSRFEITRLHKKLICTMGETNFSEISKTSILKKLSGGDLIGFEYKNKTPFEDKNYAKILISTNNLPTTSDKSIGFYRRWMIIDFPNRFSEKKNILEDIPEVEYNNLALKCIKILKEVLNAREFTNEGTIEERQKRYEDKSNFFDKFWNDNIEECYDSYITKRDFKEKFDSWCRENRHREMSDVNIKKNMNDKNIEDNREIMTWVDSGSNEKPRMWVWSGIKWK